ncbi:PP2C family protein-serine/threonine phosphatase [Actinoallomurus rhizosphaericola]|uniref:PP2C family protein-serine/threonine phosphatase n=1 Tax=Actinoallomurus rhizosphaericola TaxID=2952536 RepID=UPI002093FBD7|nr:GAF domain-containing SpoIIE family protein phosphatase [Actinoallomurus rhizosphaericola]MCO5996977.1 SpoIIE family protein phosphatase [Actinoallomurus rhizosphaericola]
MESFEVPDGVPSPAPVAPAGEEARLAAVRRYRILDTPPDAALDRIAALAARIFGAPIGTVTIVDGDRVWFKAAHGLPGVEEVPRGPGLCAEAVSRPGPYAVADAVRDPDAWEHPLVAGETGVRFYAAAPITTPDGHRLGTVNVMGTRPREADPQELAVLGDLAALAMDHLELRLSALRAAALERAVHETAERDRTQLTALADALQRSLLPPTLPEMPHCEIAAHYQPAIEPIGGDFYDLFPLDEHGRRWGLFIGDVVGKGAQAAGRTSLVRYTLRTEAITRPNPARMLTGLDAAITLDQAVYGSGGAEMWFCTAAAAIVRPGPAGAIITIAAGGHPPLIVLRADGGLESRELRGPIIGCLEGAVYDNVHLELAAGDTLLLYTDGLIDAHRDGARLGEDGLREFLAGCGGLAAPALMERLRGLVATFDEPADDDIAMVALSIPA